MPYVRHISILAFLVALLAPADAVASGPALVYHGVPERVELTTQEAILADEVRSLLRDKKGARPVLDTVLSAAAEALLRPGVQPRDALRANGVSDAFAIPVSYTALEGAPVLAPGRSLVDTDGRRAGITHFGVSIQGTGGTRRVGMVFARRGAQLSRFPMAVEAGDKFLLNGMLEPDLKDPVVLIATPRGRVIELPVRFEHRVFWRMIPFLEGSGRYHIEVQANNAYGVQVLNLMDVYAFQPGTPREAPVIRLRPPARAVSDRGDAERRAVSLINRSRRQAGVHEIRASSALRSEARTHAADMAKGGFFGHISPHRGGLAKRLGRSGMADLTASENIAIAPSPELAHSELMRSPSHLRNITDPHVTHVGVGVYERRGGAQPVYTFTQIFAKLR